MYRLCIFTNKLLKELAGSATIQTINMSLQHNQLKFSVLMSVYNKENPEWFEQALDSIIVKQTVTPNEVVIVCDGELTPSLNSVLTKYKTKFPNILKIFRK